MGYSIGNRIGHVKSLFSTEVTAQIKSRLSRNAIFMMGSNLANAISGFVFWVVVTHYYSDFQVGSAGALFSAISLLGGFGNLGLNYGLIRFMPHSSDKERTTNACLTMTGIFTCVLAIVFIVGLPFWTPSLLFLRQNIAQSLVFILIAVGFAILFMQRNALLSLRKAYHSMIQSILVSFLRLALPGLLVLWGAFGIVSAYGIAVWASIFFGFIVLRKAMPMYRPLPKVHLKAVGDLVRFSFKNYVAEQIGQLPIFLLPLIIIRFLGNEETAYYYIAFSMAVVLYSIPGSVVTSFFVEGSYDEKQVRSSVVRAGIFILALLVPAILAIYFIGPHILGLLGKAYSKRAWEVLWLLSLAAIPLAFNELWTTTRRIKKQMTTVLVVYSTIGIVTVIASIIMMKYYGIAGAGMGWIVGQGSVALVLAARPALLFFRRIRG